jgi:hypothetical protein
MQKTSEMVKRQLGKKVKRQESNGAITFLPNCHISSFCFDNHINFVIKSKRKQEAVL